jgi:hypothetical protein
MFYQNAYYFTLHEEVILNILAKCYLLSLVQGTFLGEKRPGLGHDHPIPSSAEVKLQYSYTSTPHLGLHGMFHPQTRKERATLNTCLSQQFSDSRLGYAELKTRTLLNILRLQ